MHREPSPVLHTWEGRRLHPDTVPKWFTDFLKAKGLPHIRFHALRHTGASLLISEGEDVMTISRRLGHADAHTTLKTYAHSFEKHDKGASDKLEARLLGVVM